MNNDYHLEEIVSVMKRGGNILYPTDTIWGLGCDATNAKAVDKVYRIKERIADKSFIILVSNLEMLEKYVKEVPDIALELQSSISEPLTIIYPGGKNLARNVVAADGSVAIRIPDHPFCQKLLAAFNKPIISTSANISGGSLPFSFRAVSDQIKESVDYIVPIEQNIITRPKPSIIVKISADGEIRVLRN